MFSDRKYSRLYIFYRSKFKYLPILWLVLWKWVAQTITHSKLASLFVQIFYRLMHFLMESVLKESHWNQKYWITNSFPWLFDTCWGCRTRFEYRNTWWYLMNLFKPTLTGDFRWSNLPTWFDGWLGVWWMAPLWA